jgi:hypothetical protein
LKKLSHLHELSPFIEIQKEADLNLNNNTSKDNNNYIQNSSFAIQKTCQIESIIDSKKKEDKNKSLKSLKVIYNNKNFSQDLKELKSAIEISDCKKKNILNSINHNFSLIKKKMDCILSKELMSVKNCKINSYSAKNNTKSENNQIFLNKIFINNIMNEDWKKNKNFGLKKHFSNEKNCPLCNSIRENNKLNEMRNSNFYYYFPFKEKYNTNLSNLHSYKTTSNNITYSSKDCIETDNHINYGNIRIRDYFPVRSQYNFFPGNPKNLINKKLNNDKKLFKQRLNSTNCIRQNKIYHNINAVKDYFDN